MSPFVGNLAMAATAVVTPIYLPTQQVKWIDFVRTKSLSWLHCCSLIGCRPADDPKRHLLASQDLVGNRSAWINSKHLLDGKWVEQQNVFFRPRALGVFFAFKSLLLSFFFWGGVNAALPSAKYRISAKMLVLSSV